MCPSFGSFNHREASIGVRVKLTKSETIIEKLIVMPKLAKKRPGMPAMKAIGMKTATSEMVVASTAMPISSVASTAACIGFIRFSSMNRQMFSSTTMASSITMPTASASASSVIRLSV